MTNPEIAQRPLPTEPTQAILEALGSPNFICHAPAHVLRACGHPIAEKAEAEQAYVLWHSLRFAIEYGDAWREHMGRWMQSEIAQREPCP